MLWIDAVNAFAEQLFLNVQIRINSKVMFYCQELTLTNVLFFHDYDLLYHIPEYLMLKVFCLVH